MKKVFVLGLCFTFQLASVPAYGELRFALVIGNGNYYELPKLKNPDNDAKDMAAALKSLGFTVDLLTDADLPTMEKELIRFGSELTNDVDTVGFFYYAGHGVQSGGENFLIPTDADIPGDVFLRTKAFALQAVLGTLRSSGNRLNIIVLDACRDNPFSWSRSTARGLTVVGTQPPGSIIAYAAGAGEVAQDGKGANGIFTGELLKHLGTPGLDIYDVFRQTGAAVSGDTRGSQNPAVYSQFYGNFSLARAPAIATGQPPTATTTPSERTVVQAPLQVATPISPASTAIQSPTVEPSSKILTVAGNGTPGYLGDGGPATSAQLDYIYSVAVDSSGNIYIVDQGHNRVRKVDTSGVISIFAGTGAGGYSGDGGRATSARLNGPWGVAVDSSGNVYIAEQGNHIIRKVNTSGIISTVVGTGAAGYSGDGGPAISAKLDNPHDVFVDSTGNLYIADYNNHRIRKVSAP